MAQTNADGSIVLSLKISTQKAIGMLKGELAKIAEGKNAFNVLSNRAKQLQTELRSLEKEYAILISQEQELAGDAKYEAKLSALGASIKNTKRDLADVNSALGALGKKATKSSDDMSKGFKNFGKRIAGIMKSALVFSVLYKVMQSVVKLFQNVLMSDEEFRQDWEELKAAFYTAAYPIINLIVPAIKFIVQQVRDWAVSIGKVAAALQGMSYSELVDQAKASKEAADNYSDMEKSSKKTADNVKKQLAGFDDIQILSTGNDNKESANYFENLKQYDASGAKSMLGDIMRAVGGMLMAIGVILLFHGQIAWGIGFIIAGAFGIAAATLTDENVSQKAKNELSNAMLIVGVIAIVLGILLCMASQWGIGIGLMIIGVSSIVAPVALNWDGIKEQLQGSFGGWLVLGGVIAIILGILLCFTPALPLGIGLIVLGAAAVVAPIVANWDAIWDAITGTFNAIIDWIKTYGLLVLGIIICLTGAGIPSGLALIIKWAKDNAEEVPLAAKITEKVKEIWDSVKKFWDDNIKPIFTAKFWLDLAKNCGNGLISGFENAINGIITMFEKMINWIVDGINSIGFDIPDWLGGGHFGFDIPRVSFGRVSIPRLAQGTVVPPNKEFMAILGDNTKEHEIVSPISTMKQAFMEAMIEMGGNFGGGNTEVILEIDGREFGRAVVEQGNRENRRIGTRLVIA